MEDNSKTRTSDAGVEDGVTDRMDDVLVFQRPENTQRFATEDAGDSEEKQTPASRSPHEGYFHLFLR
jgi:hypothetical protein